MNSIAPPVKSCITRCARLFLRSFLSIAAFAAISASAQVPFTLPFGPINTGAYGGFNVTVGAVRIPEGRSPKALSVEVRPGRVIVSYVAEGPLLTGNFYVFDVVEVLASGPYLLQIVERAPGEPDRVSQDFPFTLPVGTPPTKARSLYNRSSGKFFITASQADYDALVNSNALPVANRWVPVDSGFNVWVSAADAPPVAAPVCRFFSPAAGTHFFAIDVRDCRTLAATQGFVDEGIAFYALPPLSDGAFLPFYNLRYIDICPSGTQPVYRMFDRTPGKAAHRYTTSSTAVTGSIVPVEATTGWVKESVAFCSPL